MKGITLKNIETEGELEKYIAEKSNNHSVYKHYGSRERITNNIIREHCFYLSNVTGWNDVEDRSRFNNLNLSVVNYGLCFSFSKSESIAMWMLYGKDDGLMINLKKATIKSILEMKEAVLGMFKNNSFVSLGKIALTEHSIILQDILYCGDTENGKVYVKRSDEVVKEFDSGLLEGLSHNIKNVAWSYENECRLIVSIDKKEIEKIEQTNPGCKCDTLKIYIPESQWEAVREGIFNHPNVMNGEDGFNNSRLQGKVQWKIG